MSSTILSHFGTDQLEWVKYWVLIPLFVVSTIGVIIGVYLEHRNFSQPVQDKGWRLLLLSLGLETFFGILIFAADGGVSAVQQSEIIALDKRIAPREMDPAALADLLQKFPKEPFDLCVTPGIEDEFLHEMVDGLRLAGWTARNFGNRTATEDRLSVPGDRFPGIAVCGNRGVEIQVAGSSEKQFGPSAEALALALRKLGVAARAYVMNDDSVNRTDAIHIQIGNRL